MDLVDRFATKAKDKIMNMTDTEFQSIFGDGSEFNTENLKEFYNDYELRHPLEQLNEYKTQCYYKLRDLMEKRLVRVVAD